MSSQRRKDETIQEKEIIDEEKLPSPNTPTEMHEQIETLNKALQEAQEKANTNWERLLRKEADLQNVQSRAEEDVEKAKKFALERFAGDLLQVLDALEQGLSFANNGKVAKKTGAFIGF